MYESIPTAIEKDRVQTALNNQREFFKDYTLKMLEIEDKALSDTSTYKLLDKTLKSVDGYKGNPVDYFRKITEKRIKDNDKLLSVAEDIFSSKVYKEALSYDRVNIIAYISMCDWFADYAAGAMATMVSEVAYPDNSNPYVEPVDKEVAEFTTNRSNLMAISRISKAMFTDLKETMTKIKKLEGIEFVSDDMGKVEKQYGISAVDPMSMNLIPVSINPVYWLGQVWNSWVKTKQTWNKEDIAMLQMKIYRLEKLKAGGSSSDDDIVMIDKQISYHASRMAVLKEELEEMENDS